MSTLTADIPFTVLPEGIQIYTNSLTPISAVPKSNTKLIGFDDFESIAGEYSPNAFVWDFGDGTTSTSLTAEHIYKWPGEYTVTLTVLNADGEPVLSERTSTVNVIDFIPTQIEFIDLNEVYDIPSGQRSDPITVGFCSSWQNYSPPNRRNDSCEDGEEHWMPATKDAPGYWMPGATHSTDSTVEKYEPIYTVNMYASGSYSPPIDPDKYYTTKDSHLNKSWGFYSTNATLSTIPTNSVDITLLDSITGTIGDSNTYEKIYYRHSPDGAGYQRVSADDDNAVFVGLSGNGQFTYEDDTAKNIDSTYHPVIMSATLDTKNIFDKTIFNTYYSQPSEIGYINTEIKTISHIKVRKNTAEKLAITSNGANELPISETKWESTITPFTVTYQDSTDSNILDYPDMSTVSTGLVIDDIAVEDDIEFNTTADNSGKSYYQGYFKYDDSTTTATAKLTASMDITEPAGYRYDALTSWVFGTSIDPTYGALIRYYISDNFEFDNGLQHELRGNEFQMNPTGIITSTIITNYGSLMGQPPTVTVVGDGNGADLVPVFDSVNGVITDIMVLSGGTGYTSGFTSISFMVENNGIATAPAATPVIDSNLHIRPISVYPADSGSHSAWVANAGSGTGDTDRLLKISSCGSILSSLDVYDILDETSGLNGLNYSPSCIALDKDGNPWMTLENSLDTIQIDKDTGELLQTIKPSFTTTDSYKPVCVDIDIDNNVYIGYNTDAGEAVVVKFDENGAELDSMADSASILIDMLVLRTDTVVWLTDKRLGLLETDTLDDTTLDGTGTVGVALAMDLDLNIYTIQGSDTLVRYSGSDHLTKQTLTFTGGDLVAIAGDSRGYIRVLDNGNGKQYHVNGSETDISTLTEYTTQGVSLPDSGTYGYDTYSDTLHAFGDWTGFRWLHKFGYISQQARRITGESAEFYIYPKEGHYNIRKTNEDHDQSKLTRSYALQPWLNSNHNLWNNFIGTIIGDLSAGPDTLGKHLHEKIGNFVANNNDVDDCNIDALYSLCDMYDIEIQKYNLAFPPSFKRLLDILSIKHKRLFGDNIKIDDVFDMYENYTDPDNRVNLGDEIDATTYMLTPDIPIVAYESFSRSFSKVVVGPALSGEFSDAGHIIKTGVDGNYVAPGTGDYMQYPLREYSPFWRWPLVVPKEKDNYISGLDILSYYRFFNYNTSTSADIVENVINWDDDQTTLTYDTGFSMNEWAKDTGIADNIIEHKLREGLDLFEG
jgi:PKD repeat protein